MDIYFHTTKMQRACSSGKRMVKEWGAKTAKKLKQRLAELHAADNLEDVRRYPAAKCHPLTGDRRGQVVVALDHPRRLIVEPNHDPIPEKPDGGLDWSQVTSVLVVEVVDYH